MISMASKEDNPVDVELPSIDSGELVEVCEPRSFKVTPTVPMGGGTQLLEGAHLTGATPRFCRESRKYRDYALFFWG